MPAPLILSFDTAATHCAVALLRGEQIQAEAYKEMTRGQAEELFPLITHVLDTAGVAFGMLDAVAVGIGPGNFTGIRISVAAARGLAMSLNIPAIGVTTLEALAEGVSGPCMACIDARRGMVYLQGFGGASPAKPALLDLGVLPAELATGDVTCVGPVSQNVVQMLGGSTSVAPYAVAVAMARIAARRLARGADISAPAPLYLREADAAPARDVAPTILS